MSGADVFALSSDESDGEVPGELGEPELPPPQSKRPRKRGPRNEYCAWACKTKIDCDLFALESSESLSVEDRTKLLTEHVRTRVHHNRPMSVLASAAIVDTRHYSGPPSSHSIPITFYVQTKNVTAIPLNDWIGDGSIWTPMPGGLCGNPEFDADMSKPAPWVVLKIFSVLKLNNAGRRAKRVIAPDFILENKYKIH